jgi:hypothetical protein
VVSTGLVGVFLALTLAFVQGGGDFSGGLERGAAIPCNLPLLAKTPNPVIMTLSIDKLRK